MHMVDMDLCDWNFKISVYVKEKQNKSISDFFSHFSAMFHFYTSGKRQKTSGFLKFLGVSEMGSWLKWVKQVRLLIISQLSFSCSKSTIETLEKGVKHVQS